MRLFWKQSWHWIILFALADAACLFAVWIVRPEAFRHMALFLLLFTAFSIAAGICTQLYRQKKDAALLLRFLEMPGEQTGAEFLARFGESEAARLLCGQIFSMQAQINEKTVALEEYRDYIEAWVHEIKTSLSLFTMVLDNRREEISPDSFKRLQYVQHQIHEDVERILYYARLRADHPDIRMTRFRLDACVLESLAEFAPFLEEKQIALTQKLARVEVDSDRKIVLFLLSQLLGNAVKYADGKHGEITVETYQKGDKTYLAISNNGNGVPPEDAPFLFDKGFTGGSQNRQKATGMGLYLVRKYAQKLCVEVGLKEQIPYKSGFGIELVFLR